MDRENNENNATTSERIWTGTLEWHDRQAGGQTIPRNIRCSVNSTVVNGAPEISGDGWPTKLVVQLLPRSLQETVVDEFLGPDARRLRFTMHGGEYLEKMRRLMSNGLCGCVHFLGSAGARCETRVLILYYDYDQGYYGLVPRNQDGFIERIRRVIREKKVELLINKQQGSGNVAGNDLNQVHGHGHGGIQNIQIEDEFNTLQMEIVLTKENLESHEFCIMDLMR